MRASGQALVERQRTVLEQARSPFGNCRLKEGVMVFLAQGGSFNKGYHLGQNGGVARDLNILCNGIGKPNTIVGHARAKAATRFRQPPVLDIAFNELPRRRSQEVCASNIGTRQAKCQHILQLIAKAICATCLIEPGARPHAASQGLIWQPPIQKNVEGAIRGFDLDNAENVIPLFSDRGKCRIEVSVTVFPDERWCVGLRGGLAKEENDFRCGARSKQQFRLQGAAGIKPSAHAIGKINARGEPQRSIECAIASNEFRAVARVRGLSRIQVSEGHALAKLVVPGVLCEERARLRINLRYNKRRGRGAVVAKNPLHISRNRKPSLACRLIDQLQSRNLYRVVKRNELQQLKRNSMRDMFETAVALPVPDSVGRGLLQDRKRGRPPQVSRVLITHIDCLPRRVANGIVRPWG